MSNQSILQRMIEACDRFDDGKIDTNELRGEINSLAGCLDLIRKEAAAVAYRFDSDVFSGADTVNLYDKVSGWKEIDAAVSVLRKWVAAELEKLEVNTPPPVQMPDRVRADP